jgi:endo-1,4-beta-mannosidase
MSWWGDFDHSEVVADFSTIAASGFDSVRLFLTWEDFQPAPDKVDMEMLRRLVSVADLASHAGIAIMPTLYTGHMSGVNWIPGWALTGSDGDNRFRVVSDRRVTSAGLQNWYADPEVTEAQTLLAGQAAAALAGHEAMWAWDLGNENSNCVTPPSRSSARRWLDRVTSAIRAADDTALVTIGLHMEDLEENRMLGPGEAAQVCDFLTMHGYPIYAGWAAGTTDEHLLSFLAQMTRWLGKGREVLFSEFGLPTYRREDPKSDRVRASPLVEEETAAAYTRRALAVLHSTGCLGAMLWCYADYMPAIWEDPPLDSAVHERFFGLWRADGSPKPSVAAIAEFSEHDRIIAPDRYEWIDIDPEEFYQDSRAHLARLYRRYRVAGGMALTDQDE